MFYFLCFLTAGIKTEGYVLNDSTYYQTSISSQFTVIPKYLIYDKVSENLFDTLCNDFDLHVGDKAAAYT
jgi:hypothetical protein